MATKYSEGTISPRAETPSYTPPPLLVEEVLRFLRDAIIRGEFKPGEKLSEPALQRELGVSRSPIREALRMLEREGWVTLIPRRGAFVSELTLEALHETTVVRATLEALAARLTLERLTESILEEMRRLLRRMEAEVHQRAVQSYTATHHAFHETFIRPCGNRVLVSLLTKLRQNYFRPKITTFFFMTNLEEAIDGHARIIDAFEQGNPHTLERVVKTHILTALNHHRHLWENGEGSST